MPSNECIYICDQFTDYHENTLEQEIRAKVDSHLSICPDCQQTFQDLSTVLTQLSELPSLQTSPDFTSDLMLKIQNQATENFWTKVSRSTTFKVAGYAVAAGLMVAIGLNILLDPVSPGLKRVTPQFANEKIQEDAESTGIAQSSDSASSVMNDSLEFQQTIQSSNQSLQLVNSSK